jgi:Ca2+-binding EF-hand superfamily protein
MTKEEALLKTMQRFTNLMDGSVIPKAGVTTIIHYYESLLIDKPQVVKSTSNIESNFQEEEFQEMLNEADYWDGDESHNFLQ